MTKRCLIISCSETKVPEPERLPAVERYDGPAFRVLRRYLRNTLGETAENKLDVFILSAQYGLIQAEKDIPVYDRRLTGQRAEALNDEVLRTFREKIASHNYDELFVSAGKTYLLALTGFEEQLPAGVKIIVSRGGFGQKLAALKAWLTGQAQPDHAPAQLSLPVDTSENNGQFLYTVRGTVRLKGIELQATPEEVIACARRTLDNDAENSQNFKNWYVLVDNTPVSPKWLVSHLSGLAVSDFDASDARRVLNALGMPVYRKK